MYTEVGRRREPCAFGGSHVVFYVDYVDLKVIGRIERPDELWRGQHVMHALLADSDGREYESRPATVLSAPAIYCRRIDRVIFTTQPPRMSRDLEGHGITVCPDGPSWTVVSAS